MLSRISTIVLVALSDAIALTQAQWTVLGVSGVGVAISVAGVTFTLWRWRRVDAKAERALAAAGELRSGFEELKRQINVERRE